MRQINFAAATAAAFTLFFGASASALTQNAAEPVLRNSTPVTVGAQYQLQSEILDQTRNITVYLPMGYDGAAKSYPVLYLVDGGAAQDFHPITGLASLASLTGMMREFIVVGVETVQRRYELTTPSTGKRDLEVADPNGGAADFRRYIIEEVRPAVNAAFRTTDETAVIGESAAGFFIAHVFLTEPESFDHYISVSPSMWWDDMGLAKSAPGLLARHGYDGEKSFYLTVADEGGDHRAGVDRLVAALEETTPEGLTWWYEPMEGEHHHTIYNPASLKALRLIFAPPPRE